MVDATADAASPHPSRRVRRSSLERPGPIPDPDRSGDVVDYRFGVTYVCKDALGYDEYRCVYGEPDLTESVATSRARMMVCRLVP
jgi:hypothetical protein